MLKAFESFTSIREPFRKRTVILPVTFCRKDTSLVGMNMREIHILATWNTMESISSFTYDIKIGMTAWQRLGAEPHILVR